MKIALIAPGYEALPPTGWGAVESIVWQYYLRLKNNHDVTIFNTCQLPTIIDQINNQDWDFIHCMYDDYCGYLNTYCQKEFSITNHYGYLTRQNKWSPGYLPFFQAACEAPVMIALSNEIRDTFLPYRPENKTHFLRNGAEFDNFKFKTKGNGRAICIGKIEDRKRQADIQRLLKVPIDYVGPITDNNFIQNENYLGSWTKDELYEKLTNYSCLVLLSHGEAAPLVVPEAICAGLSIVVSEAASANLPYGTPFIFRVPDDWENYIDGTEAFINYAIKDNNNQRDLIRNYGNIHFNWDVIVKEYVALIHKIKST